MVYFLRFRKGYFRPRHKRVNYITEVLLAFRRNNVKLLEAKTKLTIGLTQNAFSKIQIVSVFNKNCPIRYWVVELKAGSPEARKKIQFKFCIHIHLNMLLPVYKKTFIMFIAYPAKCLHWDFFYLLRWTLLQVNSWEEIISIQSWLEI